MDALLSIAGPVFFVGMQISAVNTAMTINILKSVGNLSPLPFFSLLINCVVWSIYGILKWDMTVLLPNGTGLLAGLWCSLVYHKYCDHVPRKLYYTGVVAVCFALYFGYIRNDSYIGYLGCFLAVLVMGSPLATLRTVVSDRSTASLPFWTSLSGWFNSLSWLAYGIIVADDPYIYGPNLLGFVLSSVQLSLFIAYGLPPQLKVVLPR